MAKYGDRVWLEQCDMRLVFNMANMAQAGLSRTAMEEIQYLIKKPRTEVREEKKWGVEFPGDIKVKAVIERHSAIHSQNHPDGSLPCQNSTTPNL